MVDERIAFLKDAFARISAAPFDDREALTKEFAQEFRRLDPETAAKLKRWAGDGWFLWRACETALESALVRTDLTANEKLETVSDAWHLVAALKVAALPGGHLPSAIAIDFAFSALLLGLRAGLTPQEIEKIRASKASDMGRSGGAKSGSTRQGKAGPWQTYARKENARLKSANKSLTIGDRADKIMANWATETFEKVRRDRLVQFLGELNREE